MSKKLIYFDSAATTIVDPKVQEIMNTAMIENFGNASSTHAAGRNAKAQFEMARKKIASLLFCQSNEIIFTSCGTEAINLAFFTAIYGMKFKTIITTKIEHKAVLLCANHYQNKGIEVIYVDTDHLGRVDQIHLESILSSKNNCFVSIMHANNEIGTVNDLTELSQLTKKYDAVFHSDTVQSIGHYPLDLSSLGIDFITCSAHKFHGPKGVGFLYKNKNIKTSPMILGGGQESGQRAGTENVPGVIAMAEALDIAISDFNKDMDHIWMLKNNLMQLLSSQIPDIQFNGDVSTNGSIGTVLNVSFPKSPQFETLLFMLDINGFCCSGGSACNSGAVSGSHVLDVLNVDSQKTSIRFSFSKFNTLEEIKALVKEIMNIARLGQSH
jgi:cysteine desulfurase